MIDTKLITFLTLLEEKSFTKTASRLYITQPAVTHHIKSLEKEYDISLFTNAKTFELTRAGAMLLDYAKSLKLQEELLLSNLQKQDNFICNIGFTPMVKGIIPSVSEISKMFNTMPHFNAYTYSYSDIINDLSCGKLDFSFVDSSFDSQQFESVLVSQEKVVLVGSPEGQYKGKDRITREQLAVATLIEADEDSGLYKAINSALKSKNIKLKNNYSIRSNDPDLIRKLIVMTDGLAFMYYDCVKNDIEKGRLKKFDILNLQFTQNIYLIYNKNFVLNESLRDFIEIIAKGGK